MVYYTTYITENSINKKRYYGVHKTSDLDDGYLGSGTLLKYAIEKHGKENFKVVDRSFYVSYVEAMGAEAEFVTHEIVESNEWYNIKLGGHNAELTDATKKKMSMSRTGMKRSEETKIKIGNAHRGKVLSDETKRKIREKRKLQIISEETGKKISIANTGKIRSAESRKRISEGRMGMVFSEEHKLNISKGHRGQIPWNKGKKVGPMSEEQKLKISRANKGKRKPRKSNEHRESIGEDHENGKY